MDLADASYTDEKRAPLEAYLSHRLANYAS